jgi:hypothetical membrane protein
MKSQRTPGFLLAIAGIIVFLGIQLAESNYTGQYSTARDYISELGVDDSPAALIFNLSMIIAGLLIMFDARRFHKINSSKIFCVSLFLYGLGTFGVGLFPGSIGGLHGISAGILFIAGPIAAIMSRKQSPKAIARVSLALAVISIVFLISFVIEQNPSNVGAVERFVVYPITMWLIVFGSSQYGERARR